MSNNPFDQLIQEVLEVKQLLLESGLKSTVDELPYLKIDKAAEFTSASENALRQMAFKNQIPYIKKQGKLFFRRSDLIEWFESGRVDRPAIVGEDILVVSKKKGASK